MGWTQNIIMSTCETIMLTSWALIWLCCLLPLYIYHMASRVTYQNISPEVTRKPWRVMSPDAEGRGCHQARRQKILEGGSFDTEGGLGAAQGSQKPLGIWCKILQSSNFQTLHSNFRKALFSITNFLKIFIKFYTN